MTMIKTMPLMVFVALIVASSSENILYKQCDPQWANQKLGFSSDTICSSGCLVSSVAMALVSMPTWVNPSIMNQWLKKNGGYVNGDNFVWGSIKPLGLQYGGQDNVIDRIGLHLLANHVVIANVNNGGHYVWVTGVGNGFANVNDPGFNRNTYSFGQIVRFAWYSKLRMPTPPIFDIQAEKSQEAEKAIAPVETTGQRSMPTETLSQIRAHPNQKKDPQLKQEE